MKTGEDEGEAVARTIRAASQVLVLIAGPNGAGKTTFVETFLKPLGFPVVNPDAIARTLFPDGPAEAAYEAAHAADAVRADLVSRRVSFCAETVFSDPKGAKLAFLRKAREAGYVLVIVFIGLESPELSIARVVERVEQGGHDVPDEKLVTRYPRTLENLSKSLKLADHVFLFDNSSAEEPYRFVAETRSGRLIRRGPARPRWAAAVGIQA